MAAVVGALRAVLSLESAAFDRGIAAAQKSMSGFQRRMARVSQQMRVAGAGLSAAGAGLAVALKGQVDAADEMSKAAQKFGVPIETLSRLAYAAELSDVSMETLGTSARRLATLMDGAAQGNARAADLFARLGISATDAEGALRPTEAVFAEIADVLAVMPDGAEKTALALQAFGKSGTELIPLLNGGAQSIREMMAEADELGLTIDTKTGRAAEAFNDNLTRLANVMKGVMIEAMAALAPWLEDISERAVEIAKWFRDLSPATQEMAAKFALAAFAIGPALIGLSLMVPALNLIKDAFKALTAVMLRNPFVAIGVASALALWWIYENWDDIAAWFSERWTAIKEAASDAWSGIQRFAADAYTALTDTWGDVAAWFRATVFETIPQVFADMWAAVKAKFAGWVEDFRQIGRDLMAGLKEGIGGGTPEAEAAMERAAGELSGTAETSWGVQSPSTVFRRIGGFLMEGLSLGIAEGAPLATDAMRGVADGLTAQGTGLADSLKTVNDAARRAFTGFVTGADSGAKALDGMLGRLKDMAANSAFDALFGGLPGGGGPAGLIASLFGGAFANGGAFAGGRLVTRPTAFAMAGGRVGLMGEGGPEAVMPLTRGPGGRLGVAAVGGGAASPVSVTVNIASGVAAGVRQEVYQMIPQIVEATKGAVLEAQRRREFGAAF